jgi:hypothetical protein
MFEFVVNPTKECSKGTLKNYKTILNKIASNLGYTSPEDLIENSDDILEFMRESTKSTTARKVFLSAIFYVLNRPEYDKECMVPYYKAFAACKVKEIKENSNLTTTDKKEKVNQVKKNHKKVTKKMKIEDF